MRKIEGPCIWCSSVLPHIEHIAIDATILVTTECAIRSSRARRGLVVRAIELRCVGREDTPPTLGADVVGHGDAVEGSSCVQMSVAVDPPGDGGLVERRVRGSFLVP